MSIIILTNNVYSQVVSPEEAQNLFDKNNYIEAISMYEILLKTDPENIDLNIKAGLCYLNGNLVHAKAVPFFQKAVNSAKAEPESCYLLGVAYQHANKFDDAIAAFNSYKATPNSDAALADKRIIESNIGKKFQLNKIDVSFSNLGPSINTEFPDYYPFVSKSDNLLIFTARTSRSTGGFKAEDGFYSSDILISEKINGQFEKCKTIGSLINSNYDEQCVGLSDDGSKLFIYSDKDKSYGDIFTSEKAVNSFKKPEKMGSTVNTLDLESSASISEDNNTLFYASNKIGGKGGIDLYMTRKLPTGEWGESQNIEAINTIYDEDFPTLSADGQTLYFCSEGHENMGGFDIFKSVWNPVTNEWSKPENLGFPINTASDERVISFVHDGFHAYVSAIRPEGLGDYDIYMLTFNQLKPKVILKIKLTDNDPNGSLIINPDIYIYDKFDNQIISSRANPNNGEYLIVLEEGKYAMEIDSPDHQLYTNSLDITSEMVTLGMVFKTITLIK